MSSTTGLNEEVSDINVDTEMTESERAIWNAAYEAGRNAGFKTGRNRGYKQAIAASRAQIRRMPDVPPALPEEQEMEAKVPLTTSIDELGFTDRTTYALKSGGIHVIADIFKWDEYDLIEIRNLGSKSIDEINTKLAEVGYIYRAS